MKRIKPDELPAVLTEDVVQILVAMSIEFPKATFDWADVSQLLEERGQLQFVLEKVQEYNKKKEGTERNSNFYENPGPNGFYGNMGQPETVEEYKNRCGKYPPGYDENGIKITSGI